MEVFSRRPAAGVRGPRPSLAKERFWREHVARQAAAGISVRAYCRRHALKEPSFYAWRRELAKRDRARLGEREIETSLTGAWREERFAHIAAARQERARPVLDRYFSWLEAESPGLMPKNPVRQAMDYSLRQRAGLLRYSDDGRLSIDNGAAERSIRGIALGRRNWLFCGSERGARAACVYFTLAASCRRHGHDPFAYLRDMFRRLPILTLECGGEPAESILRPLLPDQWRPAP